MISPHTIVSSRLYLSRTRSQIKPSIIIIRTHSILGQHESQARTHSNPVRRFIVDRTQRVQPQRPNSTRNVMNHSHERPSSNLDDGLQHPDQSPRAEYLPNTEQEEEHVYVLTVKTTESLTLPMNEFRERYFPKRLNRTPAHLTLFHALPHSRLDALDESLTLLSTSMASFHVSAGKPFRMRQGVGINLGKGYRKLKDVHEQLQSQWLDFLSEQDAGGLRPHWTVMNKVKKEDQVAGAFDTIQKELLVNSREGQALGLLLWNYNGGSWELAKEYMFGSTKKNSQTSG